MQYRRVAPSKLSRNVTHVSERCVAEITSDPSSGSVILPVVAQVAADEPETAAKIVHPMMLVWSRRPGMRSSHGARPLNMSSDSRVRNRISPIHTNNGSAVSVHEEAVPQMVTAIASPAGREENSS